MTDRDGKNLQIGDEVHLYDNNSVKFKIKKFVTVKHMMDETVYVTDYFDKQFPIKNVVKTDDDWVAQNQAAWGFGWM